jgi:hypothetical protein
VSASRQARTRLLVGALAAAWLVAGFANVARGVPQAGARYRFWAFQHHCYSDVIALFGDRYLGGGRPVPYLQDRIEYPPLLGLALWLPALPGAGPGGHLALTALLLAGCLALAGWALERLPGTRPWWLLATPALAWFAFLNWDLVPIAFLALALLALERGLPARAGVHAALGASAKLFPVVLLPAAVGALAAPDRRRDLARLGAGFLAAWAVVNVPVALAAFDAWSWFFRFNAGRGAENSLWHALAVPRGPLLDALSYGPVALSGLAALLLVRRATASGSGPERAARLGVALVLVTWIACNKIWSPQYALYGFLAGALAAAPGWLFGLLSGASIADFHLEFELRARRWDPWFMETLVRPGEVARTLLWLVLAAWILRALVRAARAAPPAGPQ